MHEVKKKLNDDRSVLDQQHRGRRDKAQVSQTDALVSTEAAFLFLLYVGNNNIPYESELKRE